MMTLALSFQLLLNLEQNPLMAEDNDFDDISVDTVCAFCDDGGLLLCCEGVCKRSFHGSVSDAEDPGCPSLGLTHQQVQAMTEQEFYCDNCVYKQHQCFACGELGSSDISSGAEVFCCGEEDCNYFYHPHCVARLLNPGNEAAAENQLHQIVAGGRFACPLHKCLVCNGSEEKSVHDRQFAVCRRCPKAYHRQCLPSEIGLGQDGLGLANNNVVQRAYEELIPNRILMFCMEREMDADTGMPIGNHIRFPEGPM